MGIHWQKNTEGESIWKKGVHSVRNCAAKSVKKGSMLDLLQLQLACIGYHSAAERDRCVVFADDRGQYVEGRTVCGWMGRQRDDHRV